MALFYADIAGTAAAMTESDPGVVSEKASDITLGEPESAAAEAMAREPAPRLGAPQLRAKAEAGKAFGGLVAPKRREGGSVGCRRAFSSFVAEKPARR